MIVYNGISIDSVAPVMIEDIKVSPIRYNPIVRPRAVRFGSEFVRMGGGERTVTISLALLDKNPIARQAALLALSVWARTDGEYRLELPTDPARYLVGVCTAKPEPSTRAWWENKLKLVFTCYNNPFWTAKEEKSVACGTSFYVFGDAMPLYAGNDTQIAVTMALGGYGAISVASNIIPKRMVKLMNNCLLCKYKLAKEEQNALLPFIKSLFLATNPAPIKYIMAMEDLISAEIRLPLDMPSERVCRAVCEEYERIRDSETDEE
jgi:hypothetical protein